MVNNDDGIYLSYSSNKNSITGNDVIENKKKGIWLDSSPYNTICGNHIINNQYGILIDDSNNTITKNTIAENEYGVQVYSPNNKFYHNNFINNTDQVYVDEHSNNNIWDDGYPSGGNYWSGYAGVDEKSGPNQDQPGSDGIGDVAYTINANNTDGYPLMAPFSAFGAGVWNGTVYNVDIISNSSLSNFNIDTYGKTVSFNVTGEENQTGFCRITIPDVIVEDLWQGNYTVLLNGEPWPYRNWTDTANTYIYLNYSHSEHQIVIIPEFP